MKHGIFSVAALLFSMASLAQQANTGEEIRQVAGRAELAIDSFTMPAGATRTVPIDLVAGDSLIAFYADIRLDSSAITIEGATFPEIEGGQVVGNAVAGLIRIAGAGTTLDPVAAPGDRVTIATIDIRATGAPGDTLEIIPWILKVGEGAPEQTAGAIARIILSEALPVELVGFWGAVDGNVVSLAWQTTYEENSSHFDVVRFREGDLIQPVIGRLESPGDRSGLTNYQFSDTLSAPGAYYYLIRQFDLDSWFQTYGPVRIEFVQFEPAIISAPWPNPSAGGINIDASFATSTFQTVELFDMLGRRAALLFSGYTDAQKQMRMQFNTDAAAGGYILRIAGDGRVRSYPITIIR